MIESPYSVYIIKNTVNDKVYVGITKNGVPKRFMRHKRDAINGSQSIIHRAMRKLGTDNFYVEVVAEGLSDSDASKMEIDLISSSCSYDKGGYNIHAGGRLGVSLRPSLTRSRKSKAAKAAWLNSEAWQASVNCPDRKRKISESSKKRWESEEVRALFSERHADMIAASITPEVKARAKETYIENGHAAPVACSNGMEFRTSTEAAEWASKETGLKKCQSNICKCASGKRKSAYGFNWWYLT